MDFDVFEKISEESLSTMTIEQMHCILEAELQDDETHVDLIKSIVQELRKRDKDDFGDIDVDAAWKRFLERINQK